MSLAKKSPEKIGNILKLNNTAAKNHKPFEEKYRVVSL